MGGRALSAIMFSPRGGSAYTARTLVTELPAQGWAVRLVSGSLSSSPDGDARTFYRGLDLDLVDYDREPMHPSYEDRSGAPDRVFATVDDLELERHVRVWGSALRRAGALGADVLHLHHLTPVNEAAGRLAPWVPVVGQLHGTELLMLEAIESGPPAAWRFADRWARRLRTWAARCARIVVAPGAVGRAADLLGLGSERFSEVSNGIDVDRFRAHNVDRASHWHRHLVREPRGWRPGEEPGSARYRPSDLAPLRDGVVLTYVGRFTEVKRLGLLIRAFVAAQERLREDAALVLVGGHPGEWEGEHPADVIAATGARNVFLAGWHEQERLSDFLSASDVIVQPSAREQFGLALVEGMACGLPALAARSFGASRIVDDGRTGWLVDPDDGGQLADAIVAAVNDEAERRRRGVEARRAVLHRYSGRQMAAGVAAALEVAQASGQVPLTLPGPQADTERLGA